MLGIGKYIFYGNAILVLLTYNNNNAPGYPRGVAINLLSNITYRGRL